MINVSCHESFTLEKFSQVHGGGVLFYICCGVLSKNTNKRSSAAAVVDQMIGRTPNMKTKAEKEIYPQKEKKSQ